jgi:hypothetical protein
MNFSLSLLLSLIITIAQAQKIEKNAAPGFELINQQDLKKFLTYLSSDELQGRETSYPGQKLAAAYIADHFKAIGLKPIGDNDTYLQKFDVELVRVSDETNVVVKSGSRTQTFSWIKDFVSFGGKDTSVSGGVVVVGYMDNRLADSLKPKVVGKVVVAFAGQRKLAKDTSSAQLMRRMMGFRNDAGSVATLVVTDDQGSASYSRLAAQLASFGVTRGQMRIKGEAPRQGRTSSLMFYVSPALAADILQSSGISLKDLREKAYQDSAFAPLVLDQVTVTLNSKMSKEDRTTENVVGLLEGSDPILKKEVIVFSGHYDHLGVGANGAIYHGADDDGSGTVMVMELAKAFSKNPTRPKRSLMFLTVTGEEKGLLGSSYYTSHPIIPLEQTVADFNTDMIGRMDTTHEKTKNIPYTYVIGSDKISTELDSVLQAANRESNNIQLDYTYNDENDPNQFYRRSDHYNFARKGVPIAFFFTGVHVDYHQPTDTIDKILFDRMVKIGQVVYYAGWKTANFGRMFTKNGTSGGYR